MGKLLLTTAVFLALAAIGSADAADLPPPPRYLPGPAVVAPVYSWTGCYLGAGGGFGVWNEDNSIAGATPASTAGGRGYFGQGQVGCDYQFSPGLFNWNVVVGLFGDGELGNLKSHTDIDLGGLFGQEKETSSWAAGARIGVLVTPNFLPYTTGGYTQAHVDQVNLATFPGGITGSINSHNYNGYFLGTGFEYGLPFVPGLFLKSEYRYSVYESATLPIVPGPGAPVGLSVNSSKDVQTFSTELVYRFNWLQ